MSTHRDLLRERLSEVFVRHAGSDLIVDRASTFTGADLERGLERWLEAIGSEIPEGGYVGVLAAPSAVQGAAVLWVLASGRVPVMLNPWTATSRPQAGVAGLHGLVCSGVEPGGVLAGGPVVTLDRRGTIVDQRSGGAGEAPAPAPPAGALVLHTSGSTGTPKRVLLAAEGLLYMIDELIARFGLDDSAVAAVVLPVHHTTGLNTQFLPTVLAGGRAVVSSPRWLMGRIYRDVLESGATFVSLVNELLRPSLEEKRRRGLPPATEVAEVQLAGSTAGPRHLEMARELFPAARLHRCYGLTEAIRVAMIASDDSGFDGDASGRALPGMEIEIRDRDGEPAGVEATGEIWVRGPSVMLGYLDGDDRAALDGGWLATGDLGHLTADGRLVVEERCDRVFKSYGHRVAPAEIERAARSLPAVAEARCIPVPCPARGRRPVLFLESAVPWGNGHRMALEATLLRELDPFKVPKDVVVMETLPRSAAGKVDLAGLDRLWRHSVSGSPLAESSSEVRPGVVDLGRAPAGCRFTGLEPTPTSNS